MGKVYVISDTHFGHSGIIRLCGRPFAGVEDMDATLIKNWNNTVQDDDIVFHLGDFTWYSDGKFIFDQLKGQKILIKGNHDKYALNFGWQSVHDYLEIKVNENRFVLFHYPIEEWHNSHSGAIHLYGHVHQNSKSIIPPYTFGSPPKRYNVSVEVINYTPIDISTFIKE